MKNLMNKKLTKKETMIIIGVVVCLVVVILIIYLAIDISSNKNDSNGNDYESGNDELDVDISELGRYVTITSESDNDETEEVKEEITDEVEINIDNGKIVATDDYDGYSIVLANNKYYLVYNDKVLYEIEVTDDYTGKTYYNSYTSEYMYAMCSEDDDKEVICKLSSNNYDSYGYFTNVSFDYDCGEDGHIACKIFLYSKKDGSIKEYTVDYNTNLSIGPIKKYTDNAWNYTDYFIIENGDKNIIYNISDKREISYSTNYNIISDVARLSWEDWYETYRENYIVFEDTNTGKYGLMNYSTGKVVISASYDSLLTTNKENVILAMKNNKYGAIDLSGNTIIGLSYDGIISVGDYYVVSKNYKIGMLDKNGKTVVDLKYEYDSSYSFEFRLCCDAVVAFDASKENDGSITVSYMSKDTTSYYDYDKYINYNPSTSKVKTGSY